MAKKPRKDQTIPAKLAGAQAKQIADLLEQVRLLAERVTQLEEDADHTYERAEALRAIRRSP